MSWVLDLVLHKRETSTAVLLIKRINFGLVIDNVTVSPTYYVKPVRGFLLSPSKLLSRNQFTNNNTHLRSTDTYVIYHIQSRG